MAHMLSYSESILNYICEVGDTRKKPKGNEEISDKTFQVYRVLIYTG